MILIVSPSIDGQAVGQWCLPCGRAGIPLTTHLQREGHCTMSSSLRHHIHSAVERAVRFDLDELTLDLTEADIFADLEYRGGGSTERPTHRTARITASSS